MTSSHSQSTIGSSKYGSWRVHIIIVRSREGNVKNIHSFIIIQQLYRHFLISVFCLWKVLFIWAVKVKCLIGCRYNNRRSSSLSHRGLRHLCLPNQTKYRSAVFRIMTFWCGSGSWSCYFRHWPSRRKKKKFCLLLFEGTFTSFFIDKSPKDVTKQYEVFSYYFWFMIEGSESGSGSIPLTNRSGSVRPRSMWIRCIRIRNIVAKAWH